MGNPSDAAAPGASLAETAAHNSVDGASKVDSAAAGGLGSRSAAPPGNGGAGSEALGDLRAYARRLSAVVARQRHYPASAARLGMEGTVHVHLRVRGDGTLMEPPRLVRSSGQDVLDAEALRMVEAAAPFEPMPESASRPDAAFVIPVVFSLRPGN